MATSVSAFAGSGGGPKGHPSKHDCWDRGCNGANPQTAGCASSAYTVYNTLYPVKSSTTGTQLGYVELRYSTFCGSNWSRVTTKSNFAPSEGDSAQINNNYGDLAVGTCYGDGYSAYSCMLGGSGEQDFAEGWVSTPNGVGYGKTPWG
jgi:hypothetical protein